MAWTCESIKNPCTDLLIPGFHEYFGPCRHCKIISNISLLLNFCDYRKYWNGTVTFSWYDRPMKVRQLYSQVRPLHKSWILNVGYIIPLVFPTFQHLLVSNLYFRPVSPFAKKLRVLVTGVVYICRELCNIKQIRTFEKYPHEKFREKH